MSQLIPEHVSLYMRWLISLGFLSARYLIFAGLAFLIFYVIKRRAWLFMKIQQKYPERKQIFTEIKYSLLTFFVFATMSVIIRLLAKNDILTLKVYRHFLDHSISYYMLTTVFIIFF